MRTLQISLTGLAIACVVMSAAFISRKNLNDAVTSSSASHARDNIHPSWHETRWPFLMDQWGLGRAFNCTARDCGTEINVYVRAKIGFCNCTTGVADDEEIDRIGDVELISARYAGDAPGNDVAVADMKGRSRRYRITGTNAGQVLGGQVLGGQVLGGQVLVVAFSRKCDVMVATAVAGSGHTAPPEALVLQFLNGDVITGWATRDLGA
ncbi:hypothetical protein [Pseudorhodoplanes sinuspersici]|uniref:Uncharacterized protein n=1 Tax=Pseudorhodoplanes sinuspersici TaxID=1235591 RepID=A0A1W6ZNC2_9HYPH|nr:hypothetical protein [Pseudorhodoplanes sinuspersici]ARP98747.1 hypothetical protein CAK95_06405 [Pseudorhodoplanes sinuspersici]RKE69644.1 hypothetical protein DFP91_4081 [Pseudorhodoplanes sinuspersici]